MKVLVACEFSGIVRDAFIAKGHDAVSCDLLPTERPGPHIQGDVLYHLAGRPKCHECGGPCTLDHNSYSCTNCERLWPFSYAHQMVRWDLMIAHPPCTYLSYAATRVWNKPGRAERREEALVFLKRLYDAPVPKICVENPVGYQNTVWKKPTQIIHPYYFGEPYQKRTCLWLKDLPALEYEDTIIPKPEPMYICQGPKSKGKRIHWSEGMRGVKDRAKARSETFKSIANAMAEQWG